MIFTNTIDPRSVFLCFAIISLVPLIIVLFMKENSVDRREENSILKHFAEPIVYRTLIYLFLARSLVPSFGSILYFFWLNEIGFQKSMVAFISLVGYICLFVGSSMYNRYLRKLEYWKLMCWA